MLSKLFLESPDPGYFKPTVKTVQYSTFVATQELDIMRASDHKRRCSRGYVHTYEHGIGPVVRDLVTGNIVEGIEYAYDRISNYFFGGRYLEGWKKILENPDESKRTFYNRHGKMYTLPYIPADRPSESARFTVDTLSMSQMIANANGDFPYILDYTDRSGYNQVWLCFTKQIRENDEEKYGDICETFTSTPFVTAGGDRIDVVNMTDVEITRKSGYTRRFRILGPTQSFFQYRRTLLYDPQAFTITWRKENDVRGKENADWNYEESSVNLKEPDLIKLLAINGISDNLKRVILSLI